MCATKNWSMANAKRSKVHDGGPDLSVLRPSVTTSIAGVLDVLKAYTKGTDEIRNLLTQECDIIFECKVCRNIFRCLPNFISHKRVYCKTNFNSTYHFSFPYKDFDNSDCLIIENTLKNDDHQHESQTFGSGSNNNPNTKHSACGKDLTQIIETLLRKQRTMHKEKENILQLDNVDTSNIAVYQTVKYNRNDDIKKEINEIYRDEISKNNKNLDENGKIVCDDRRTTKSFKCNACLSKFDTEKMLLVHHKKKHNGSTLVYKCPSCPKTFLQVASVMKHLSSDHNKSQRRIRSLRFNIARKRLRMDETQPKTATIVKSATEIEPSSTTTNKEDTIITIPIPTNIKRGPSICPDNRPNKVRRSAEVTATKISPNNSTELYSVNRPVRNRIQKNHKDFIYDLPNISTISAINSASTPTSPTRGSLPKRRNTIQEILPVKESEIYIKNLNINSCKNSAYQMAKKMVDNSKAAFKYNPKSTITICIPPPNDKQEEQTKATSTNIKPNPLVLTRRTTRRSLHLEASTKSSSGDSDQLSKSTFKIRVRNNLFHTPRETGFQTKFLPLSSSSAPTSSSSSPRATASNNDLFVVCPTATEFQQYLVTNKLTEPVKKIMVVPPNLSVDLK